VARRAPGGPKAERRADAGPAAPQAVGGGLELKYGSIRHAADLVRTSFGVLVRTSFGALSNHLVKLSPERWSLRIVTAIGTRVARVVARRAG